MTDDQPFTHLDATGQARMVDVTAKQPTPRIARAAAFVRCSPEVVAALRNRTIPKGDAFATARIAGISGAKRTAELLPLAHVIGIHAASVDLDVTDDGVEIRASVSSVDRTGVEMEALTGASIAALALVDMVKGMDRTVEIAHVRLLEKQGGRSGTWRRPVDRS
jgi:cyclic pyranopterin phosphate synthase